ncbi:MAG TPA: transcription elongation factor subunit Spt4 [Candidatus Nanoarchaeia archaeon]|nr:transcription elongation factor subunit Spt4 [Candidatus Nanoarchaeia archaeon]
MAKKVCRKCKIIVEGNACPLCKGDSFTDNWKGRIFVTDADKSEIAKKIGIKSKGEYAIKIR